jgi:hypothetical protein
MLLERDKERLTEVTERVFKEKKKKKKKTKKGKGRRRLCSGLLQPHTPLSPRRQPARFYVDVRRLRRHWWRWMWWGGRWGACSRG